MHSQFPNSQDLKLFLTEDGFDIDTSTVDQDMDSAVVLALFSRSSTWLSRLTNTGSRCQNIIEEEILTQEKINELYLEIKTALSFYSPDEIKIEVEDSNVFIKITKNGFEKFYTM